MVADDGGAHRAEPACTRPSARRGGQQPAEGGFRWHRRLEGVVDAGGRGVAHELLFDDVLDPLTLLGDVGHLAGHRRRHHHDAVRVADDVIAGADRHAADAEHLVDAPRLLEGRPLLGRRAVAENREAVHAQCRGVTDGAVRDEAGHAALHQAQELDVAPDRLPLSGGRDDEHLLGAAHLKGRVLW